MNAAVAGHVEDADAAHRGEETAFRAPRGTGHDHHDPEHDHLDQADDRQRPERMAIADLGEEDAEQTDPDSRDKREAHARWATRLVADPRHEDDRDDRQRDPDQRQRRWNALEHDPGDDRDQRRDHAR